ncbi:MAG: hypothetical protein JSV84_05110 [Gemmatimonadota bacterium]|nr:MAG: hypothetical protein JSV84_05110 [Gemmatimonadota bacterium]
MKRIVPVFVLCLILSQSVWSQTENWEAAYQELSVQYEEALRRLAMRDTLIQVMQAALDTARLMRENTQGLLTDVDSLRAQNESLAIKYDRMIALSDSIQTLLRENVSLSQQSVSELDSAIVDLNKKYNRAVRECLRPWYLRWEFYMGGLIGGLIGMAVK